MTRALIGCFFGDSAYWAYIEDGNGFSFVKRKEPWHSRYRVVLVVLFFVGALLAMPGSHESRAGGRQAGLESYPTDSLQADQKSVDSVNLDKLKQYVVASTEEVPVDTTDLAAQINAIIADNSDIIFGVSIKDITSGLTYNYGNLGPMTAASVSKVLTATDYFKEVELGHKSLDTILVNGYSASYNIEQMIVESNNNAWETLNEYLTYTQMQAYAQSIGLTSYYYADNVLSSSDTTLLFGDLYERKLLNESNTQSLLSYMERANYRDLIIPAVPTYNSIYHKAGWYDAYLNDAVIISNSTNAIVLSIYTESPVVYDKPRISSLMQAMTTPTLETFGLN